MRVSSSSGCLLALALAAVEAGQAPGSAAAQFASLRDAAAAILAAVGAGLFVVSDSVLAFQCFLHPLEWGHVVVVSAYFAAQSSSRSRWCCAGMGPRNAGNKKRLANSASRCVRAELLTGIDK
jgi:hypothetical protein